MTFPGKNYPGQRGFPTPNSTPSETRRRIFVVPADAEWLGLVMGAVEVLREEWRWYEWGALTPAEAAAAFNTIIIDAFENVCPPMLPGGGRVIRINATTGKLEEGADDGTWEPPTGDYAVPPITPREGTPDDIRCLAAANAAHVLELLYESVTDSIAHELEVSEAYAALVTAFIAAVGWEFAPIAFALAAFFLAVFAVVYEIVKIIGADLWDGTFTDTLKCALYNCSSADGEGVVTFDWTCAQNALAAGTDALNFDQLRLFNQLNFIIQVIGGADGLNQAGATTAITEADCSGCNVEETCHLYSPMVPEPDTGWTYSQSNDGVTLFGDYDSGTFADMKTLVLNSVNVQWTALVGTGSIVNQGCTLTVWSDDVYPGGHAVTQNDLSGVVNLTFDTTGSGHVTRIFVHIFTQWSGGGAYQDWSSMQFEYDPVASPFGWSEGVNCTP